MSELPDSCSPELRVFDSPDLLVEAAARTMCAELAALSTGAEALEKSAGPAELNTRAVADQTSAGPAELNTRAVLHEQSAGHAELRTGVKVHEQSTGPAALSTERVSIAIAGGFVSHKLLPRFRDFAEGIDWNRIDVFWVDERFVAAEDPDRNDTEAMRALFTECEGVRLHPMPSDEGQSLEDAVARATSQWRDITGGAAFDLVILGMGPDGHIASLFPGRPLHEDRPLYALDDSPKPPARRITFSLPVLRASKRIHLIAAGAAKAEALARVLAENEELEHNQNTSADSLLPAARVLSDSSLVWADSEAAALI